MLSPTNSFYKRPYFYILTIQSAFFCLYLFFFVSNTISVGDSGELIAAAWHLGIPHPPGYPLYTLIAKAVAFVPFGNIAYRANILSLFLVTLILPAFFYTIMLLKELFNGIVSFESYIFLIFSLFAFAFFATTPSYFNFMLISEVYALNAFLFFLILFISLHCNKVACSLRIMYVAAFLAGLAIANHHTIILALPLAFLFKPTLKKMISAGCLLQNILIMATFFLMGLSVYIYLPIRSVHNPIINWGTPQIMDLFIDVFFRKGYGGYPLERNYSKFIQHFKSFDLVGEFGFFGLFCGVLGFYYLWKGSKAVSICLALTFLLFSAFIILLSGDFKGSYEILKPFYIPALLIFTLYIFFGLLFIVSRCKSFMPRKAALLLTIILVALSLYLKMPSRDYGNSRKEDFIAFDYGMNTLKSVDLGSRYLAPVDSKLFALWYLQMVERFREDVDVVPVDFLSQDWYSKGSMSKGGRIIKNRVYTASLDEAALFFPDADSFSRGITFTLDTSRERADLDVWKYYTIRGIEKTVAKRSYEYRNVINDYAAAYFNLGVDQYMYGNTNEAADAYERSLKIRPGNADVLNNLSLAYADMGINLPTAELMAKDAIESYIEEEMKVNASDTLGWVYYRMGRYSEALEMLEACSNILYEDSFYRYHLGMTLFAMNRFEEAKSLLLAAIPDLYGARRTEANYALESIGKMESVL